MWIKLFDKVGIEIHFIRLLYLTIFDVDLHERHHYPHIFEDFSLLLDLLFLIAIITPLFIMSLRYLTYPPIQGPYKSKLNALLAPIGVLPIFLFRDYDILFMGILVTVANLLIAWNQLDGDDDFTWM